MAARPTHDVANDTLSVSDAARSSAHEMSKYFGPLRNSDIETFASDAFAHETHNLPRAYVGRNKFLMATIDFLITKDDDWYTRFVLPWLYTEELHVKWNIWRFNRTMMDYEPEQGVPRYVSYESESRSDSLVRRGLAFIIEHGFYKTEIGRQHYLMNLKQIVEAVHETVYYGVIHELLACPNFYQQWQHKHGRQHSIMSNDATTTLAEERWRFACVQKDVKGLFVLDAEIKDRMRRVGIEPDAWIFPSKMAIYASMIPEYFNEYSRGGAKATTALEDGAKRFDTFRGNRVFETRSFDTDFMNAGATEPLTRNRQIGEYYLLGDHHSEYSDGMQIFDMSKDAFTIITHADALANIQKHTNDDNHSVFNCMLAEYTKSHPTAAAQPLALVIQEVFGNATNHPRTGATTASAAWFSALETAWAACTPAARGEAMFEYVDNTDINSSVRLMFPGYTAVDYGMLTLLEYIMQVVVAPPQQAGYAGPPATFAQALTNANGDTTVRDLYDHVALKCSIIPFPYKLLVFRPRMTYRMSTALLLKGGEELGQTMHGHHDFQLTDDVIHKTHIGHYTFYSKSVVRDPKLMYHAEDVYCSGYVGGENTRFIKTNGVEEEFNTNPEVTVGSNSLLVVPVGYTEKLDTCLSLTGNLVHQGLNVKEDAKGGFSTFECTGVTTGTTNSNPETSYADEDSSEVGINGVCFRGAQKRYHDETGDWKTHTTNTGHWGPNVYDGCGMVRMGMYAHLKII